ncbi:hypothetical protein [Kitasatospora sp. NPDC097643]|uniref:hypothetical protein n=1 Tax=Kitasatospora sp. NPDC097643 TaxID=3157230 RepID=UPI0033289E19
MGSVSRLIKVLLAVLALLLLLVVVGAVVWNGASDNTSTSRNGAPAPTRVAAPR